MPLPDAGFFQHLIDLKIPPGPWYWVEKQGQPVRLKLGTTVLLDPNTRQPVAEPLEVQFQPPIDCVNFDPNVGPQFFKAVTMLPNTVRAVFLLRDKLLEAVELLEAEGTSEASKKIVRQVKDALDRGQSAQLPLIIT